MGPKPKRLNHKDTRAMFMAREKVLNEKQQQLHAAVEFCQSDSWVAR